MSRRLNKSLLSNETLVQLDSTLKIYFLCQNKNVNRDKGLFLIGNQPLSNGIELMASNEDHSWKKVIPEAAWSKGFVT